MSDWKNKIFDDFWKYLLGAAGGSSVTGLILKMLGDVPLWIWIVLTSIVFICMCIGIYWYLPRLFGRINKRRNYSNWVKCKNTIDIYHNTQDIDDNKKAKLEKDYKKLREKLLQVTSMYNLEIRFYLDEQNRNRGEGNRVGSLTFGSYKQCFSSTSLKDWKIKCNREIPKELDSFDDIAREISLRVLSAPEKE